MMAICRSLNIDDIPRHSEGSRRFGGQKWTETAIRVILHNKIYTGLRCWNRSSQVNVGGKIKKKKKPEHEVLTHRDEDLRIITDELEAAVQDRLSRNADKQNVRREGGYNRAKTSENPFSGVFICGLCGRNLTLGGKQQSSTYGCPNYRQRSGCQDNLRICSDWAAEQVTEALKTLLLSPDILDIFVPSVYKALEASRKALGSSADSLRDLLEQQRAGERSIKTLISILETGSTPGLMDRLRELEGQKIQLGSKIQALRASHDSLPEQDLTLVVERTIQNLLKVLKADAQSARKMLQKHLRLTLTPSVLGGKPIFNVFSEIDLKDGLASEEKDNQLVSSEGTATAYQLNYRLCAFLPPLSLGRVIESPIMTPLIQLLTERPSLSEAFQTPKDWAALIDPYLPVTYMKRPIYAGALGRYFSRDRSQLEEHLSLECTDNAKPPGFLWKVGLRDVKVEDQSQLGAATSIFKEGDLRLPLHELLMALFATRPELSEEWLGLKRLAKLIEPHVPTSWPHPVSSIALGRYFRDRQQKLEEHFVVAWKNSGSGRSRLATSAASTR